MKWFFLGWIALVPATCAGQSQESLDANVEFADGRTVVARIDDSTDDEHLWLRHSSENVVLATSYAWDEVTQVKIGGETIPPEQLAERARDLRTPWAELTTSATRNETLGVERRHPVQSATRSRPASIAFVATLANWDGTVEPDGYEVVLTVFDQFGCPTAVRGSLTARLLGERDRPYKTKPQQVELERWSERVTRQQFAAGPAVFRLPFRRTRPETEMDISRGAILHVEVGAFGHGRFASSTAVPVREFSPLRDRLQQQTDRRFMPGERTERWSRRAAD